MEDNKKPNLDGWDDFAGQWLKADIIKQWPVSLAVIDVDGQIAEGKAKMWIVTEYPAGMQRNLNINKTNQNFIKAKNLFPRQLIGKVLVFNKCRVRDPKGVMVDSFELIEIKDAK